MWKKIDKILKSGRMDKVVKKQWEKEVNKDQGIKQRTTLTGKKFLGKK